MVSVTDSSGIFCFVFITLQKGKSFLRWKATQKPAPCRIWPAGCSLTVPDLECQGAWSHNTIQTNSSTPNTKI